MVKFRESQTAKNLLTSFAGESQARNRYTYFSKKAREDGYIQIADIFEETAHHECEHALRFFKFFNGGELEITWRFPAGVIKSTQRCTRDLETLRVKKGLNARQRLRMPFPYLKNNTRNATANWQGTSKPIEPF